jgi:hypothetical protein
MLVSRIPEREESASRATIAPPGETATSSGNGHGASYIRRRFRRKRDGETDRDEDAEAIEVRGYRAGDQVRPGAHVDVLV